MSSRIRIRGRDTDLDKTSIRLLDAGVSRQALYTTLVKEGRSDLRDIIQEGLYINDKGDAQWMVFYPAQSKNRAKFLANVAHCDLIFNLFLKESWLYGLRTGKFDVLDMYQEYDREACYLVKEDASPKHRYSPYVFISDFYPERRDGPRFERVDAHEAFFSYMRYRYYQDNVGFVLQSVVPPMQIDNWWPPLLVSMLQKNAMMFEIASRENT